MHLSRLKSLYQEKAKTVPIFEPVRHPLNRLAIADQIFDVLWGMFHRP